MTETHEKTLTVSVNMPGPLDQDARLLLHRIEAALIESDESRIALTEALAEVKRRHGDYERERQALKKPVIALACVIHAKFRGPINIMDSAIRIGNEKLLAYDTLKRDQADARAVAEAQVREEATKRKAGEAIAVLPSASANPAAAAQFTAQAQAPVALGNSQGRPRSMTWSWNVTNIDKIDPRWLALNTKLIDKVVAEHKDKALEVLGEGFGVMFENAIGLTPNT